MAYTTFTDFRTATLAEWCQGLSLTSAEASDANMATAIARFSQRFDDYVNDHFESAALTLDLDGSATSRLYLPKRCTALSSVSIRNEAGTVTAQGATVYRLRTSLIAGTTRRSKDESDFDWLDVVPYGAGLTGLPATAGSVYAWPSGPQTVQVAGTFGWSVVPGDVKRAVALMVFDHFKPLRSDLRRTDSFTTADAAINLSRTTPTGIPEADAIIAEYAREGRPDV